MRRGCENGAVATASHAVTHSHKRIQFEVLLSMPKKVEWESPTLVHRVGIRIASYGLFSGAYFFLRGT